MSDEELKAELERLRTENAVLKKGASSSIRMKVSEKGAVSIYGMGRFPVTLWNSGLSCWKCRTTLGRSLLRTKRN
jgi:hypothetical protein